VDWATFGSMYSKMQKRRNFITKFCFFHLLTGTGSIAVNLATTIAAPPATHPVKAAITSFNPLHQLGQPGKVIPFSHFSNPLILSLIMSSSISSVKAYFASTKTTPWIPPYILLATKAFSKKEQSIGRNNLLPGKYLGELKYLQQQYCTGQLRLNGHAR
jgi:hypothetical protein